MTSPVRVLAVGAAAPARRLAAADVAAAWGRGGGRGQVGVCAPDEDVLTLSAEAASRAMANDHPRRELGFAGRFGRAPPSLARRPRAGQSAGGTRLGAYP